MNESPQPWSVKLRKAARYVRLYGLGRTWVKVQSARHLRRRFERLPTASRRLESGQVVGLIGCGNFAFSTLAYFLHRRYGRVIGACMDLDAHRAASLAGYYHAPLHTTDAAEILEHPQIRLVCVASNHASHAEYALRALEQGKDVYIEKPHVVDEEQLDRLARAMEQFPGQVHLGFNRPQSRLGRIVRQSLGEQQGPAAYNWFIVGHPLSRDHWYHDPREGGRLFGNLCHWTDFLYSLTGPEGLPVRLVPARHASSDTDVALSLIFADGSLGTVSFTAKGYTEEGVRERFAAQRGDCLVFLDDFQSLTVEIAGRRRRYGGLRRDHGHEANILAAFESSAGRRPYDRRAQAVYVTNTALLFLKAKECLDRNQPVTVEPYSSPTAKKPLAA